MQQPDSRGTAPLLFRNAVRRSAGPEIPGHYDPAMGVWVVDGPSGYVPIVEADDALLLEIETKTKVREEADDDARFGEAPHRRSAWLAEIQTKTEVQQESDDELPQPHRPHRAWQSALAAELLTKTDVQQESDDQIEPERIASYGRRLLELETKTHAEVEQDDQTPIL